MKDSRMTVPTDFRKLERTFVIAEIGVNHEGDKDVAADLIRKAAKCGADAVKFQTYPRRRVCLDRSARAARAGKTVPAQFR